MPSFDITVDCAAIADCCDRVFISCTGTALPKSWTLGVTSGCNADLLPADALPITAAMTWTGGFTWTGTSPDGGSITVEVDPDACILTYSFNYGDFSCTFNVSFVGGFGASVAIETCLSAIPSGCAGKSLDFGEV